MIRGNNINRFLRGCSDHRDQLFCLFELKKPPWPYGWSLGWKKKKPINIVTSYNVISLFFHLILILSLHCQLFLLISVITKYAT